MDVGHRYLLLLSGLGGPDGWARIELESGSTVGLQQLVFKLEAIGLKRVLGMRKSVKDGGRRKVRLWEDSRSECTWFSCTL